MAASCGDGVRLWDVATFRPIASWAVPGIVSVLFQTDGRGLITSGDSGLYRWPIVSDGRAKTPGLRIQSPQTFESSSFHSPRGGLSLAADGRTVAVVTNQPHSQAVVLDLRTGEVRFRGEQPAAAEIAISPDGRWVASSPWGSDPEVKLWDLHTGKHAWTLPGTVCHLWFSPDGRWLVIGSAGEYQIREVGTWRLARRIRRSSSELYGSVAFTHDGSMMAIVPATGQIRLIDPRTLRDLAALTSPESPSLEPQRIVWLAFSADGTHLAAACMTPSAVQFWDLRLIRRQLAAVGLDWDLPPDPSTGDDRPRPVPVVSLPPTGARPAVRPGELLIRGHKGPVRTVAFSPDGRQIITGGDDATVRIYNAATRNCDLVVRGLSNRVWSAILQPTGNRLITSCADYTVRIHDAATGRELKILKPTVREYGVARMALRPDGRHLAAKDGDRTITLWDVETGERVRSLGGRTGRIYGLAYSPDGRRVASAGDDRMVRIWDCESGRELLTLQGHSDGVDRITFNPDGRLIASAGWDRTVRLWDAATGREVMTLRGHTAGVWEVAFSSDGKRLASVGEDGTVRIWDGTVGWRMSKVLHSPGPTTSVAFSPDGMHIASASSDGTVRVCDATPVTGSLPAK
jgi:WD40 repeat protein